MIVRFSRAALADMQAINDYVAKDNPAMAQRIISQIERATERLQMFPLSGRMGAVANTRELVISRLPYLAVYTVMEDCVDVIAIFHGAQDVPRG